MVRPGEDFRQRRKRTNHTLRWSGSDGQSAQRTSTAVRERVPLNAHIEVALQWSISIFTLVVHLEHGRIRLTIDRNFIFRLLMCEVTASWQCTLYATSTPARACLMVGSLGCTRLGCVQEGEIDSRSQSIISHCCSNTTGSQDSCASCALSPTSPRHMMSRPAHHSCRVWKYSSEPGSLGALVLPSKMAFHVRYLSSQKCNQAVICTLYAPYLIHCCV